MNITYKKQYLLSVIEQTERQSSNTAIVSKCNNIVDSFDTQESAFDWLKKNGSELEKYSVTESTIVVLEKLKP